MTDENAQPGLFTAIQEQLGLKLEFTKVKADVLVVDSIRAAGDELTVGSPQGN